MKDTLTTALVVLDVELKNFHILGRHSQLLASLLYVSQTVIFTKSRNKKTRQIRALKTHCLSGIYLVRAKYV